ncbi:hyaluronidase-1-like [Callorhinchus milii]|uniref:hyaluronidase-1-like n=1 Tax=Callorhinchus milii TaxID=7868 RepID=UPI001C3F5E3F|nr:hyaluronidase-1-like [Callorhinchus milii]
MSILGGTTINQYNQCINSASTLELKSHGFRSCTAHLYRILPVYPFCYLGRKGKVVSPSPIIQNRPFIVVWNTPTENCKKKFNIDLDLRAFDIIENQNERFVGKNITIFYQNKLGLYPYYTDTGTAVHGGVVQNASLHQHLQQASKDIQNLLDHNFHGLAVIDWEEWRPLWDRNWGDMDIYKQKSEELVRSKHPYFPEWLVFQIAKSNYETAAQNFMQETLRQGWKLRSMGLWGFYKFPDCYNYYHEEPLTKYTGQCHKEDVPRNNQLTWLWEASHALYPSIYLNKIFRSSDNARKFVHYKIKEALRVATLESLSKSLPVLPYARYTYAKTFDFLTEIDLVHTLGESAALGASGVVLWGDMEFPRTKDGCEELKNYIDHRLGRYVVNTTMAALLCSEALCDGHGRCVRQDPSSRTYLHLNPSSFQVLSVPGFPGPQLRSQGELHTEDLLKMSREFTCQCYKGWSGPQCREK